MNAIEKFAKEHGRDIDKSLASKFQQAVESVIGDRGRVIDSWVDSTGNRLHPVEWKVSIVSDDMEDDGREICLELVTDFEGKSHFICDFWDRDSNLIASEVGEVGEFDPLPLIDKVLGKSESKKNERGTTNIETYDGFEELIGYADAEYLLEDVVDVLSKYYTYEDDTFDEGQAKDDPEFTIKIEGGDERADFYSEDIFYVHLPNKKAAEELAKVLGGELSESKKAESKKSEDASSVDDLLARHNQKWLVKVSYDVDASHSAVAPFIVRADTKDAATNIALKRHRGLGYNMKVVSVEPMTESRKKSEGTGDFLDAKIDYSMFMRMCKTAAYLEEDEDYWDALWEYFSQIGDIGDALEFFDNLFQYTAWKTAEDLWTDYSNILGDKPEGKDYEEALDAYLDENDNEVGNAAAFKYGDHYLMVY